MKFEPGDYVRLIAKQDFAAREGATGKVVPVGYVFSDGYTAYRYGGCINIEWDDGPLRCKQAHGNYYAASFILNGGPW